MRKFGMSQASLAVAMMLGSLGLVDQTDPFSLPMPEPEVDPRPAEAAELGKRGRKIYSKVMRETGDRAAYPVITRLFKEARAELQKLAGVSE